jgi:exonuclease VII small subunit
VEINAGTYGSTGIFNLQDYQYEGTQVNEIYEAIRAVTENNSPAEWNGRVMVRKGFTDDGNADSYFLQFLLTVNDIEIPPVETLEESVGIEVPKETLEQRRTRLKDVIARKKELAAEFRKRQKEKTMRLRERPKTKEAPATEVKSEALKRQENIKEIMDKQEKLLEKADSYFEKGIYDAKELKARIKEITTQTNLALSKFKRGGEV